MNTGSVMIGRALIGWMVWTVPGAPAMLNLMVSSPGSPAAASPEAALVLAAVSASRRVTKPSSAMESSTLVTVRMAGTERSSSGLRSRRRDGREIRERHRVRSMIASGVGKPGPYDEPECPSRQEAVSEHAGGKKLEKRGEGRVS